MLPVRILLTAYIACFGLVLGSFLGMAAVRLPAGASLVRPRSHCPLCGHPLPWYENIPVVSYLFLGGKCRDCRASISPHYLFLELATAALAVFAFDRLLPWPKALTYLLLLIAPLLLLMVIDWMYYVLPDVVTLPGIFCGFLVHWLDGKYWSHHAIRVSGPYLILESLGGALAGGLTLLLLAILYKKFRGKEGMGIGDVKLGAMLGAFFGWKAVFFVFFLASMLGLVLGIFLILFRGRNKETPLPFGSCLAFVSLVYLFYGDFLLRHYLQLIQYVL